MTSSIARLEATAVKPQKIDQRPIAMATNETEQRVPYKKNAEDDAKMGRIQMQIFRNQRGCDR
jgi:hypothetical protein